VLEKDYWILNGTKLFITNGGCADIFTTIAVADENKRTRGGFTAFIIERDMPGVYGWQPGPEDGYARLSDQ
jgi:acyl-CoA dehydrogenase